MKKENQIIGNEVSVKEQNQIILYQPNDTISLEVRLEDETVWLSQAQIVTLFNSTKSNISEHIKHIYTDKELEKESTVRFFRTVQLRISVVDSEQWLVVSGMAFERYQLITIH